MTTKSNEITENNVYGRPFRSNIRTGEHSKAVAETKT